MHMLGYPTSFIQMTCVNLLASSKFTDKRIAYVALCVLMDERSEVLLLTSHTIKKDLESSNQYIVAVALNAIGEVCTADMCRDAASEVLKLLSNNNPYIKKKAALALSKIIRKCPELQDTVAEKLNLIFEDKNHGVLLCGLSLACQIFKQDQVFIEKYKKYLPNMIRYLKNLSSTNYAPEYDINGVTDPFLQVKILEVLFHYGKGNTDASEEMNDLLASISTNTESNKNTGNAVLYELVRTIIGIESNSGLKSLGSSILGKFLGHKDNNYKYVALNTLQEVTKTDLNSVQKHKIVILECLKDNDISIKRRALDLVYLIINSSNIKPIMKECLNFLLVAEGELKLELTSKLCNSLDRYSPSLKWEIDTLIKILCLAGNFVTEETVSSVINLIVSTPDLHLYSVHKLFLAMKNNLAQEGLIKVGVYIIGELGYLLVNNSVTGPDNENITVSEDEVILLIDEINDRKNNPIVKEYLMNCYFKLVNKFSHKSSEHLKFLLEQESRSYSCEVQQRASEYIIFTQVANDVLRREISKNVPNSKIIKDVKVTK
jgi:AP-1 complex subunit gamma-1